MKVVFAQLVEYNLLWYRIYIIREMYNQAENILIDTFNLAKNKWTKEESSTSCYNYWKFYIDLKKDRRSS